MTGVAYDLTAVMAGGEVESGVPHGELLVGLVEAALGTDAPTLAAARQAVRRALGDAAFVDASAAIASFNAVVKVADATGIPIEDWKAERTKDIRAELAIDRLRK